MHSLNIHGLCKVVRGVHHIVPLNGGMRYFSAFNIPWNLVGLCRECHKAVHRVIRPVVDKKMVDGWERARLMGQGICESLW